MKLFIVMVIGRLPQTSIMMAIKQTALVVEFVVVNILALSVGNFPLAKRALVVPLMAKAMALITIRSATIFGHLTNRVMRSLWSPITMALLTIRLDIQLSQAMSHISIATRSMV